MSQDLKILGYRLDDKLDEGGMGAVWRAEHVELGRIVAVKLMKPELRDDSLAVRRFKQEARLLSRLRHPNIVAVENLSMDPLAIIMEYMAGSPLRARMRAEGMPLHEAWPIFKQLLDGAEELHQRGVVHRDLKPANLLFAKPAGDWIKILDFGVALEAELGGLGTAHGKTVGTPEYMPPEQHRGEGVDPRADVYALGVILYEMLAGERPFKEGPGEDGRPHGLAWHHSHTPPPPHPNISPDVFEALEVALDKEPTGRFSSAAAFKLALAELPEVERPSTEFEMEAYRPQSEGEAPQGRGKGGWWRFGKRGASTGAGASRAEARAWDAERAALKGQLVSLEAELKGEQARRASLQEEARRAERSELRIRQSIEEAERARGASEAARAEAEAARDALAARLEESEAARDALQTQLEREIARVAALEAQIAGLKAELAGRAGLSLGKAPEGPQPAGPNPAGIDWVFLPSGAFEMGSSTGGKNEGPVHRVEVPGFFMGRAPVTVAQYRRAVEAGVCRPPQIGRYYNWGEEGREDHPINGVSWEDAHKFAEWAGGRLPSEAEWELAASAGARRYPWGDEPADCTRAVLNSEAGKGCGEDRTWAVGSKPAGDTPQGLSDMAGNVWEWCADTYKGSYAGAPTDGSAREEGGKRRACRGGSWFSGPQDMRATIREGHAPKERSFLLGFRVACDA